MPKATRSYTETITTSAAQPYTSLDHHAPGVVNSWQAQGSTASSTPKGTTMPNNNPEDWNPETDTEEFFKELNDNIGVTPMGATVVLMHEWFSNLNQIGFTREESFELLKLMIRR
jgi:hypothetical protein